MTDIVCPACAAVNRVPPEKPAEAARCGKCHQPLFSGQPAELTATTFKAYARTQVRKTATATTAH